MQIHCYTNLDLNNEVWPKELEIAPNVGDIIQSRTRHTNGMMLELEVVKRTITYSNILDSYVLRLELHIPKNNIFKTISEFQSWYERNGR